MKHLYQQLEDGDLGSESGVRSRSEQGQAVHSCLSSNYPNQIMMAAGYWQVLILAMAIMAFGIGLFYLTYSGDLPDPGKKRAARLKGWGLLGCFLVGVLVAGL